MIPVVLSGGSGTRLWPVSRNKLPKQFCHIFSDSLHSMTLQRLMRLSKPWVVTSQSLKDLTERQVRDLELNTSQIVYEPQAKNTAPAIALLCHILEQKAQKEEIVGIFPADHLIEKEDVFLSAVNLARDEAKNGKVVTLGIQPCDPATGFGYIQTTKEFSVKHGDLKSHSVVKFHEKPSLETAKSFLAEGNYFWNAGIFVFKVSKMIELFKKFQPEMWTQITKVKSDLSNIKEIYESLANISIDYAIMENLKSDSLACIPCDIGWNDVGSWDAISEILNGNQTNENNNYKVEVKGSNNFIHSNINEKTYAFAEVNDLIVVDTADALLVTRKGSTQTVKDIVDVLKLKKPKVITDHVFEERPWGKYEILKDTEAFKSKVIHVNPKQQISYQSHAKREEHWLITQGDGEVILNDKSIPVHPGSYVKIPLGAKHRIKNTGEKTIEFVEVQMGTYFGEDDIVRYQDDYNRA